MTRALALVAFAFLLLLRFGAAQAETAADNYYWRPASTDGAPRPYVVLLPGSSGLKIFDDDQHYFRAAAWLNTLGVDALVIDYHRAVKFIPAAKKGEAGPRMRLIVEDALATLRSSGKAAAGCPSGLIGWSLGGEGGWAVAARPLNQKAVVLYYPTTRAPAPYRNVVPVLAVQGEADDVTPAAALDAFVKARAEGAAPATVRTYPGAAHGFDIESIVRPRTLKFPPVIGQKATFGYDAKAAGAARREVEAFLREKGVVGGVCG